VHKNVCFSLTCSRPYICRQVFDSLDSNTDGEVSAEEIKADITYDTNKDGAVSDDEAGVSLGGNSIHCVALHSIFTHVTMICDFVY